MGIISLTRCCCWKAMVSALEITTAGSNLVICNGILNEIRILSYSLAKTLGKAWRRTANAEHLFPLPLRLVFQCTTYTVVELCLARIPLLLRNKHLENKTEKEGRHMCIVEAIIVINERSKKASKISQSPGKVNWLLEAVATDFPGENDFYGLKLAVARHLSVWLSNKHCSLLKLNFLRWPNWYRTGEGLCLQQVSVGLTCCLRCLKRGQQGARRDSAQGQAAVSGIFGSRQIQNLSSHCRQSSERWSQICQNIKYLIISYTDRVQNCSSQNQSKIILSCNSNVSTTEPADFYPRVWCISVFCTVCTTASDIQGHIFDNNSSHLSLVTGGWRHA